MQRGFTLIESLIYIVILSLIVGGFVVLGFQVVQGENHLSRRTLYEQEAVFLGRKLDWALSGASSADVIGSSALWMTKRNFPQNPIVFSLVAGVLEMKKGGGASIPLNSMHTPVSSLLFEKKPALAGKPPSIRATFSAGGKTYTLLRYLW